MKKCWIITEGIAGTENQCLGVAENLNVDIEIKRIKLNEPWNSLSPYIKFECSKTFSPSITPPWPDIVLASGRKSIAASRYIKKLNGQKTLVVQIQDPRVKLNEVDLICVPEHDPTRGPNVITTTAAPNRITSQKLDNAKKEFSSLFASLPSPRLAVLIGGNSNAYTLSKEKTKQLCEQLLSVDASLMITASRRTGEENRKILQNSLRGDHIYFWDGQGSNPYFGILAWADYVLITSDSVSMISEAATTGKPVYILELDGGNKRLNLFHKHLKDKGITKTFDGKLSSWTYKPLNDSEVIAQEILRRLKN
jgi:mitochondrial fission protein ELM1